MRSVVGGLLLASVVLLSACSGSKAPEAPAVPIVFSIPLEPNTNGVLEPRSGRITVGTDANAYSADVALSPSWWVTADGFKIVWFAGLSQTTRYFQISGEIPGEAARPKLLKSPKRLIVYQMYASSGLLHSLTIVGPRYVCPLPRRVPFVVTKLGNSVCSSFRVGKR